jgi:hypothetical protein
MIAESEEGRRGDPAGRTNAGTSSPLICRDEYIKQSILSLERMTYKLDLAITAMDARWEDRI